jgi:predicted glycosyltransferase
MVGEGSSEQPYVADPVRPGLRFLFYSHDGLGLGHIRRNLAVANALTALIPDTCILVVTSAEEAEVFGLDPGVDLLKLPAIRKIDNGHYAARRFPMCWEEVRAVRERILTAAVDSFRPDVLLVDKHPFGVDGELGPALDAARSAGAHAVLGLRDVLDDPATVRSEWDVRNVYDRIPTYYDRVLVYGQPHVFDPRRAYAFPDAIAALTRFCGYVVSTSRNGDGHERRGNGITPGSNGTPLVLATAGGGEDGFALLSAFIQASASARWQAVAVVGPQCPPERAQRLRALATLADVGFHRFVPNVSESFPSLDALVAMGGYNTLAEAIASGVPTVCVPRVRPRREQLIRAQAFADLGLLQLVEPHVLDASVLHGEIEAALAGGRDRGRGNGSVLDLEGAPRAALQLAELAGAEGLAPSYARHIAAG